jgi:hypothetical protein
LVIFFASGNAPKIYSSSFVIVLLRKSHIKKLSAAGLLFIFLFTQGLKLVHSHSYRSFTQQPAEHEILSHPIAIGSASLSATVDCTICDYQIAKNTDFQFSNWEISLPAFKTDFIPFYPPFKAFPSFSFFETRGPPVLC